MSTWPTSPAIPYDYVAGSTMATTYPNRIESALESLGAGGGRAAMTTAASAIELTLPNSTDTVFKVTGTTDIHFIDTTDRQPSNIIWLHFESAGISISHGNIGTPSDPKFMKIYWEGTGTSADEAMLQRSTRAFIFEGTYWSMLQF